MDSQPQPAEPENGGISVKNPELPASLRHPQCCETRGACQSLSFPRVRKTGHCLSRSKVEGGLTAGGQIRGRDSGAGDRCSGFGKDQGFPLQSPFKQTEGT